MSTGQVVIAMYRAKPGHDKALEAVIARHVPTLRRLGLATKRPVLLLRSLTDATYLELFEWVDEHAAGKAHGNPDVMALWDAIGKESEFVSLGQLAEAGQPFPHFRPVDGVVS
jgi:hypothetical protein